VVLGASNPEVGTELRAMLSTRSFRVYRSDDMTGIELGGALKNIFAIAAGVVDGLGLGDNAKAALVTRSVTELTRLGVALGGVRETFMGLSGVGDLMVTCYSRHSRNRGVGERLGKGESIGCITASMQMVAEGVPTTYSGWECARRFNVRAPIIEQVRNLLDGTVSPLEAMDRLMSREAGSE
jgi:glycerol-3-phosphate dehydrogenase (NAD(P)+)